MRHTIIFILTFFSALSVCGQTVTRQTNETAEMFANRFKPDSTKLAHSVIETSGLDTTKKIIIAFYNKTIYEVRQMDTYVDHSQYNILIGYAFIPISDNSYKKMLIDTIPPDGGDPDILAIFFANADKVKDRELVVLCIYEQRHYEYGGAFYETFIYDYSMDKFEYIKPISEKFRGCECWWRNGRTEKAKYKTAKDIRAGLIKIGYK